MTQDENRKTVKYRLYFAMASQGTCDLYHCTDVTHHYVFYAKDDEAAGEVCESHIDGNILEVNPLSGLYRFGDDRTLERVGWRKSSTTDLGYFRDRSPSPTHDPATELRRLFSLSELPGLLRMPVTKTVEETEWKKPKKRPRRRSLFGGALSF